MGAGAVEHKDVVISVLTVSAALAGLVLVFLGLVVSTYQGYESKERGDVKGTYRFFGGIILAGFLVGLISVAAATSWLVRQTDDYLLYVATIASFAGQLVLLVVATVVVVFGLLWS